MFGQSLAAQDEHVATALDRRQIKIAIAVRGSDPTPELRRSIADYNRCLVKGELRYQPSIWPDHRYATGVDTANVQITRIKGPRQMRTGASRPGGTNWKWTRRQIVDLNRGCTNSFIRCSVMRGAHVAERQVKISGPSVKASLYRAASHHAGTEAGTRRRSSQWGRASLCRSGRPDCP